MSEGGDRFVVAPADSVGSLVTVVGYETVRDRPVEHRGLPSPFLTFIVTLDEPVVLSDGRGERRLGAVLAGLHLAPETVRMPTRQTGVQAAVHPLAARRLFGVPAAELAGLSLEAGDVLGDVVTAELRERLAGTSRWDERFAILSAAMGARAGGTRHAAPRPEVAEAWRLLSASRGQIRIADLAQQVFLSRRRLSAAFAAELGVTPKEAARTMRFTHAVTRIGQAVRAGSVELAAVAAECGYADQSHLVREFHGLAGTSPSGWIAEEFPNLQAGGHRYAREWEA